MAPEASRGTARCCSAEGWQVRREDHGGRDAYHLARRWAVGAGHILGLLGLMLHQTFLDSYHSQTGQAGSHQSAVEVQVPG